MSNEVIKSSSGKKFQLKTLVPLLLFVAMVVIFYILRPAYLNAINIKSILVQTSFIGIISLGLTLVMMTGGVDMSNGYTAGLGAIAGMWFVVNDDMSMGMGLLLAVAFVLLIGVINGLCVSKLGIAPFVATLGTMYLCMGLQNWLDEGGQQISYGFPKEYVFLGQGSVGIIPMPLLIFVVVFIVLYILTEMCPMGRYLRGSGLNQFASKLSGINVSFWVFLSYVLSSLLAGTLGYILGASQKYISSGLGSSYQMDSLLTVLLGKTLTNGKISVWSTTFGALFLMAFQNGLSMLGMPVTTLAISKGVLLIGLLLFSRYRKKA
ncbi:MAG: ABC transporter permease [Oscillospiraceae bacterium]|nr:ABC transporter permease [Oscillospiraceae bacterium]